MAVKADIPVYRASGTGIVYPSQSELVRFLGAHHLTVGIGTYWDSTILEIASLDSIRVLPGVADPAGRIVPLVQIRKRFNFPDPATTDFFVIVTEPPQTYNEKNVLETFGAPSERFSVAGYRVFGYTHCCLLYTSDAADE